MKSKHYLELIIDKLIRKSGRDKKIQFAVRLDPKRYESRTVKGEKGFFDKKEKIFIPEAVFKILMDEMTVQPIKSAESKIEDLYSYILGSQMRVKRAVSQGLKFETAIVPSEEYLKEHVNTMLNVVVLYVDIAGSTNLGMKLSPDKLATVIKIFIQEMSFLVSGYHGYVLKYAGDSVIAYFPAEANLADVCSNTINCARAMMKVVEHAINAILRENGYPELKIKIGIDVGKNQIVRLGEDIDLLGYTMSIAGKMVEIAKPGQIVIGDWIYDELMKPFRDLFSKMDLSHDVWNYKDSKEGRIYPLYCMDA
ncbi:MAG: adenylate/guanylate cyclase domain-containing protein [Nitrososphaerales archaeon]